MNQFMAFVKKEFAHVLRDRKTLFILFGMPVMQILIFGFALTNEIKNSSIVIVDHARDEASQHLISRFEASRFFEIEKSILDPHQIENAFKEGNIKLALIIPSGFNST